MINLYSVAVTYISVLLVSVKITLGITTNLGLNNLTLLAIQMTYLISWSHLHELSYMNTFKFTAFFTFIFVIPSQLRLHNRHTVLLNN